MFSGFGSRGRSQACSERLWFNGSIIRSSLDKCNISFMGLIENENLGQFDVIIHHVPYPTVSVFPFS